MVPPTFVPAYCRHGARDKGYIRLDGRVIYLPGKYGSPESQTEYNRYLAQWVANGRQLPTPTLQPRSPALPITSGLVVEQFILAYLRYARTRYAKHGRFYSIRAAFKPMRKLFCKIPLAEFGPRKLKEVRQALIERGLVRREINRRIGWIIKGIAWAVEEELCPGEVLHRLKAVEILRRDEGALRESHKVQPVDEAVVLQTIEHVSPEVKAMVQIELLTGARSGEICVMKGASFDMSKGDVWVFRPERHKTQNLGHDRLIPLGKRAQEIIRPFLVGNPNAYLFSPQGAEHRRRQKLHEARKTPAGQGNNLGTNKSDEPEHTPGARYTTASLGKAITRAIEKAFPLPAHLGKRMVIPTGRKKEPRPETQTEWWNRLSKLERAEVKAWRKRHHWHPHQLRHSAATAIREQFGLDAAQAILGHANLSATQIYASLQTAKAIDVARKVG